MNHYHSKKTLIFIVLLLPLLWVSAQENQKNRISISIGPAIPIGDIKNSRLDSSLLMNGFAKTGVHFNVTYTYNFANNFGISSAFFGNVNSVNMREYNSEYQRVICERYPLLQGVQFSHDNDKGSWTTGGLLIGPNINFYIAHHFYLEIRGLIGLGLGYAPEIHHTLQYEDLSFSYQQKSAHTESFAWNVGAGFNYRFQNLFVRLNVDYLSSKLNFKNLNIQYIKNDSELGWQTIPQPLEILNQQLQISAGVGLCF